MCKANIHTVKMSNTEETESLPMCKAALSVLNAKIKKIWANLTIEPAYFLMSFAWSLSGSTGSEDQLLIYKSCRIDFNKTDETCHKLSLEENKTLNHAITDEVLKYRL